MGMFDTIRCKYPLPLPQYQDFEFQTKDTPAQWMHDYEIRADGTLWHDDFEEKTVTQVASFTGEIRFYTFTKKHKHEGWIEFSAYFKDGILNQMNILCHEPQS